MIIKLIAVGEKMPAWIESGYSEYEKRLKQNVKLQLIEIPVAKRTKTSSLKTLMQNEAKAIKLKISKSDHIVILDFRGTQYSTETFAEHLSYWQTNNPSVAIIIGGPDGIDESIKKLAQESIALSKMTFPHPMVRVIFAEQIYRAWSYLKGHPYHK